MILRAIPILVLFVGGACSAPQTAAFAHEMLAAHNAVRRRVKMPPLTWSPRLAAAARAWAETLISRGAFEHNSHTPYGENLFEIHGRRATPSEVVADWADEAAHYDHKANVCRGPCGHYTQIVWRDTKEVGCATAHTRDREVWICEYNPPGNILGQRPY
jgi:uncharacterized protein YkwD